MALILLNLLVTHEAVSRASTSRAATSAATPAPSPRPQHQRQRVLRRHRQGGVPAVDAAARAGVAVLGRRRGRLGTGRLRHAATSPSATETPTSTAAVAETPPGMKLRRRRPQHRGRRGRPGRATSRRVVIRWGDPVLPGAPKFDVAKQTAAAQRQPVRVQQRLRRACCPIHGQQNRFLLVANHEYISPQFMFPGYDADDAPPASSSTSRSPPLGLSVVEVERTPPGRAAAGDRAATTGASPPTPPSR